MQRKIKRKRKKHFRPKPNLKKKTNPPNCPKNPRITPLSPTIETTSAAGSPSSKKFPKSKTQLLFILHPTSKPSALASKSISKNSHTPTSATPPWGKLHPMASML
jgi:hypothetical protein